MPDVISFSTGKKIEGSEEDILKETIEPVEVDTGLVRIAKTVVKMAEDGEVSGFVIITFNRKERRPMIWAKPDLDNEIDTATTVMCGAAEIAKDLLLTQFYEEVGEGYDDE
jgi:hypothetical protein